MFSAHMAAAVLAYIAQGTVVAFPIAAMAGTCSLEALTHRFCSARGSLACSIFGFPFVACMLAFATASALLISRVLSLSPPACSIVVMSFVP